MTTTPTPTPKSRYKENLHILIDTREQQPFFYDKIGSPNFPGLQISFGTLQSGDYSIQGMSRPGIDEHSIALERKSLPDLFGSTGRGRDRLEREFERLSFFTHAALIIEADWREIFLSPPETTQMKPKSVFRTIIAFCQRYKVHPWACPDRIFAEKCAFIILKRFWDDRQPGGIFYKQTEA